MSTPVKDPTKGAPGYASKVVLLLKRNFFDEMTMPEQTDILSDAEREALAVVSAPVAPRPLVLVVDDNAVNREALILYLKSRGIDAVGADGAEEARLYLHYQQRISLMITDLRMQPEDGLDLIRTIRESERAALSIIVVSGDTDVKEAVDVMHLGVVDFLLKPVDLGKLLELVKKELKLE
ncbi:response regulator [Pseudomonas monteilii]|jgi:PleD family two-component response regulator|uniref:Response regulator n=2 Tax=Pseudomonas putida group TaxID=136845 RepID=A0AAE6R7Y9_9PSED|nr:MULTISPECIES: response regulator [Pseudomonas]MBH3397002.1 response regulator [Pseudomonas monteilii]MBH3454104.1 response regulator [Pseudomonas monteilii]MCJ7853217.1 response regulator [Pseudomonas monteilii]MDD2122157.1 response regulator [Pseudomonas monteilii]PXX62599.1 response regulator receiver domain-containing protein [Pseudomonas sp. LAIL14HWK12:I1]